MQFGPEWMRPKTQTSRSSTRESSPPPMGSPAPPGGSTYSALLTPSVPAPTERLDGANPFKYSRDELLRIYQEGGGKGSLGLEVERWEGVVREVSNDPVALKEISEADKKVHLSHSCPSIPRSDVTTIAVCRIAQLRVAPASINRLLVYCKSIWRQAQTISFQLRRSQSHEGSFWFPIRQTKGQHG